MERMDSEAEENEKVQNGEQNEGRHVKQNG
jgi:hypothetical protein